MANDRLGLLCCFAVCHACFRCQLVKRKNPGVIAKVRRWLDESNGLR